MEHGDAKPEEMKDIFNTDLKQHASEDFDEEWRSIIQDLQVPR